MPKAFPQEFCEEVNPGLPGLTCMQVKAAGRMPAVVITAYNEAHS